MSNLTNLLAFAATGLSFLHFTGLMLAPWLVAVAVEFALLRWLFRRELAKPVGEPVTFVPPVPMVAVVVVGLAVIVLGAVRDRRITERRRREILAPPERTIPRFSPDAATPRRSSAISSDSASVPGTETFSTCGARGASRRRSAPRPRSRRRCSTTPRRTPGWTR